MHISLLAVAALVGIGFLRVFLVFVRRARNPLNAIPGPWYNKFTSVIVTYQWLRGKRAQYVQRQHEKHGSVVRLGPNEVDFSSISGAKRIHSFNKPFPKAKMYEMFRSGNGSYGVFSTRSHEDHARHRRLLAAPISESSLKNFEHIIQSRANLAVEKIGIDMKKYGAADVLQWWFFYATDVIGELTFGDSFRMLEQGKVNQYALDLQQLTPQIGLRVAFPRIIKLASYLPLPMFSEAYVATQRMRSYAEESIRRYESIVKAEPNNPKPTLFTKLYKAGEETLSWPELVADSQTYITAGSDTTAHSMTYLTWAVCRDESIRAKLVKEVQTLPDGYRDEDLKALPYLNQVIQETLRVYGAAPALLPRDVPPSGTEIDGYWLPGGTEQADLESSFHPSRWESPTKDMKDAWQPFGAGARICIGLHLAQLELRIATAKFFRTFPNAKVSTLDGFKDADMEQFINFISYPKGKRCLIQES
ncbi:sterigmatocystin biosynthesis P450 monooxygenase STCB-like protein 7 [Paraphaeosphaeria sporulosa]